MKIWIIYIVAKDDQNFSDVYRTFSFEPDFEDILVSLSNLEEPRYALPKKMIDKLRNMTSRGNFEAIETETIDERVENVDRNNS